MKTYLKSIVFARMLIRSYLLFFFYLCYVPLLQSQYHLYDCDELLFQSDQVCELEVTLFNALISEIGPSLDSFDVTVKIDLWDDNLNDYVYSSLDTIPFITPIHLDKTTADKNITITLPETIVFSCYDHKIEWTFMSMDSTLYQCYQYFRVEEKHSRENLPEFVYWDKNSSGPHIVNAFELGLTYFSNCGAQYPFSFSKDWPIDEFVDFGNPVDGWRYYDCYGVIQGRIPLYFWYGCDWTIDSIEFVVNNYSIESYQLHFAISNIYSLGGNEINEVISLQDECERGFGFNCELFLNNRFSSEIMDLELIKRDSTYVGVDTRDLLVLRDIIESNEQISESISFLADLNDSGSVSALDLVELRKLVMQFIPYQIDDPWRFFIKEENNPFLEEVDANQFYVHELNESFQYTEEDSISDFIGLKVGDIDGSYFSTHNACDIHSNYRDTIPIKYRKPENPISLKTIPFIFNSDYEIHGIHFEFTLDQADFVSLSSNNILINSGQYAVHDDLLIFSWLESSGTANPFHNYVEGDTLFQLTIDSDLSIEDLVLQSRELTKAIYVDSTYTIKNINIDVRDYLDVGQVQKHEFNIYPNPFVDHLTIALGRNIIGTIKVEVINVNGQIVYKQLIDNPSLEMVLEMELTTGVHFAKITYEGNEFVHKLLCSR